MKNFKLSLLAATLMASSVPAMAYEAGDVLVRLGPALVAPDSSSDLAGVGDVVEVDDGVGFGISGTYFVTDMIGVELLGALPFEHNIEGTGVLAGIDAGSTEHLPPTLLVNFYPNVSDKFQPFVGLGYNYTMFFNEKTDPELDAALGSDDLSLSDSHGIAYELGVDVPLSENMTFSATVWNIDIDTVARVEDAAGNRLATIDVEIDPMVYMIGIGMKF